jgi:carboxyl-terminal processing protease
MEDKKPTGLANYKVWEPLLLAIMVILGMFAGQKMTQHEDGPSSLTRSEKEKSMAGDRIEELIKFVESRYVDDVDADALVQNAIEAVLSELDPHSSYLPPDQVIELDAKMRGNFEGIGVEFDQFDDTLVVIHVIEEGPAMRAGIRSGDKLLSANDSSLIGAMDDQKRLLKQLKGKKGSKVVLGIRRSGEKALLNIEVIRDVIPIYSIPAAFMIDDQNGYIKIDRFSSTTYKEFMDAVEGMVDQEGMKNLVIDVRENPGGYLQEAVNILSQLFEERNKLIVYTEGEHSKRTEYKTTGNQFFDIYKVTVLIDQGSASASEILAGAIQDHDRGIIIGTPSFGKGLVQEQYKLSNGGALRLTIARYFTPSGRLIQRPYDAKSDQDHMTYYLGNDSVKSVDSTQFFTSNGRIVYGEGGIKPDIEVENRLNWRDPSMMNLYTGMVRFAISYLEKTEADEGLDIEAFRSKLPSDEALLESYSTFLEKLPSEDQVDLAQLESDVDIAVLLRSSIMSYQFGHAQWYREMVKTDPLVMKAMEVLKSEMQYSEQLN